MSKQYLSNLICKILSCFEKEKEDDNYDIKNNAFYSALYNAWFENRMERDKSLLVLSSGGIGLVVALTSFDGNTLVFIFSILSLLSFLTTIWNCLSVFKCNTDYLEKVINDDENSSVLENKLRHKDAVIKYSFMFGIIFAILLKYSPLLVNNQKSTTLNEKEVIMMSDDKKKESPRQIKESLEGVKKIMPQEKPVKQENAKTENGK
ncbi:MAG: hypothetical protein JW803_04270 [Endomicrobiales bacterium]|nr:hypothetical protein [Endomicrobiales bacterium]